MVQFLYNFGVSEQFLYLSHKLSFANPNWVIQFFG